MSATLPGAETSAHTYATVGDRELQLLLHLPAQPAHPPRRRSTPLIVWCHGSAFFGGAHLLGNPPAFSCPSYISKGYAIAQIDHRSSTEPGGLFPAGVHDVKAAVRYLRHLAQSDAALGLDPERIASWGASSGGYYSSILGILSSPTAPDVEGVPASSLEGTVGTHLDVSSSVCCAVDYFGPSDFLQMDAHSERDKAHRLVHDGPESPESSFMGFPIQEQPSAVQRANTAAYASADCPPMLIVHGDEDKLVPHHQSRLLHEALVAAGAPDVTLYIVAGGGHGDGFDEDAELQRLTEDFLERHLKGAGGAVL